MRGLLLALLLAGPAGAAPAAPDPGVPYITASLSATGMATAPISVTVYQNSGSGIGPLAEWGLSVTVIGSGFLQWALDVQVSNDDLTWTTLLRHESTKSANSSMVWALHHRARSARLRLANITSGAVATATAYAEP